MLKALRRAHPGYEILSALADRELTAADAMKITAPDLVELGIVDRVIPEPLGGAHMDTEETCRRVGEAVREALDEIIDLSPDELREQRYQKYRRIGVFLEG